jgi:hypothetical protein
VISLKDNLVPTCNKLIYLLVVSFVVYMKCSLLSKLGILAHLFFKAYPLMVIE